MEQLEQKFLDLCGETIVYTVKQSVYTNFYEITIEGHLTGTCLVERLVQDFKKSNKIASALRNLYSVSHITFK